jgi:hypothetical protein
MCGRMRGGVIGGEHGLERGQHLKLGYRAARAFTGLEDDLLCAG